MPAVFGNCMKILAVNIVSGNMISSQIYKPLGAALIPP